MTHPTLSEFTQPKNGDKYWAKGLFKKDVEQHTWGGDPVDIYLFKAKKLFLTEEDARKSL